MFWTFLFNRTWNAHMHIMQPKRLTIAIILSNNSISSMWTFFHRNNDSQIENVVSSTLLFLKRLCCLPRYNVTTFKIFVYAGASINMDYHSVFLPKLCTNPDFSFNRTVGLRNSFNQEYDMTLSIVMSMTSPTSDSHFSQGATHTAGNPPPPKKKNRKHWYGKG